jgi:UDP-N-acetylglucosamine:LPS N-acetylglucosamine transferase
VTPQAALHLAVTDHTAAGLRRYGAGRVEVVRPLVRPQLQSPPARRDARQRLGLGRHARVCLVNGGSWAAGGLVDTVRLLDGTGGVVPAVLCGRDPVLRERVRSLGSAVAVPWTSEIPSWLAAADVLVDNAGGQTCFEALACGTPVVVFRPLPGHGRLNAEALAATGLAAYARNPEELRAAVDAPGSPPALRGADAAEVVLDTLEAMGPVAR